jgi:hypothetical protein
VYFLREMIHRSRAIVLVTLALGIHCESRKSETVPTPPAPAAPAAFEAAPPPPAAGEAPAAAKDAGPDEWYACAKPDDCVVVPEGRCCTSCDPVAFRGYTAVSVKHKTAFAAHEGCAAATCPTCPVPDLHTPRSDSNFLAMCRRGRCVAVDLRYSPYSQCATHADCALRRGVGCCEGCGDKDLVTFNPKSALLADMCPAKVKCAPPSPACLANRGAGRAAECVAGYCQLADN